MLVIGPYTIAGQAVLAPMAGVSDAPFRRICRELGAALTPSEMLTSDTRLWQSRKSQQRLGTLALESHSHDAPRSVQIAGADPLMMSDAARAACEAGAQIIDINMGCPAKKVCKKAAGSALLADEALVRRILDTVVNAVSVPVTLKIRTGSDERHRNGVAIAKIAEGAGVQALTVHGRTRACRFRGLAEYDTIRDIVDSVNIPVIANGDITHPTKAACVLSYTGANAVMIGRGAYGNPWIFRDIDAYLRGRSMPEAPSSSEVIAMMCRHLKLLHAFYGDHLGPRIARKHIGWYCQAHFSAARGFTRHFNQLDTLESQHTAVCSLAEQETRYEEQAA